MRCAVPFLLPSPDTKVYAALGNHDFHPKNQFPPRRNSIYQQVAELWRPWLNNESITQFQEGIGTSRKHGGTWHSLEARDSLHFCFPRLFERGAGFIRKADEGLEDIKSLGQDHVAQKRQTQHQEPEQTLRPKVTSCHLQSVSWVACLALSRASFWIATLGRS